MAEIKRAKLRAIEDVDKLEVAGSLELINAKGTKVCSERTIDPEEGGNLSSSGYDLNQAHLAFLSNLDGRPVEILCINGCTWRKGLAVQFLEEALALGNVRTLILSRGAVRSCLPALYEDPGVTGYRRWSSPIYTPIIRPDPYSEILRPLLIVAQSRKVAGFPFKSVSLFLWTSLGQARDQDLGELRTYVGELKVVTGDDALDWDADRYFLDGLDHLLKGRDVQWDYTSMYRYGEWSDLTMECFRAG